MALVTSKGTGKKAEQRRVSTTAMMEVALSHFITKGYGATSVEEVAAGAGFTKGAVYFYFKSKDNLLNALLDEAERRIVQPSVDAVDIQSGSASDKLVAFLHSQARAGYRDSGWMTLIIVMSVELHGHDTAAALRLQQIVDRLKSLISDICDAGKADGSFRVELSTPELVTVIFAVTQGCFLEWYRNGETLDGQALVRALRRTVLRGVLAEPPRP